MAGIKEVAARVGVSISTVSYAISGKRSVSASTRARVMQAARELGYAPRSHGRLARGGETRILALSSPMDERTVYGDWSPYFFGVARRSHLRGYDILALMGEDEDLAGLADSGQVDGILLMDVTVDDPRTALAAYSRVPVVSLGCPDSLAGPTRWIWTSSRWAVWPSTVWSRPATPTSSSWGPTPMPTRRALISWSGPGRRSGHRPPVPM